MWDNFIKIPREPLKNVGEVVSARQKQMKKRSLYIINEHFESAFNAAMTTQIIFQRFPRSAFNLIVEG